MTAADLSFADSLRALAGWNQTRQDWQRFLAMQPDGCFVAEWDGTPAGTATTTIYGPQLAWIGMVLVHPDYRRRGIGRALLGHGIEYLRRRGVRSIKLDATPLGKKVYDELGFTDEWKLKRWQRTSPAAVPVSRHPQIRGWTEADARRVEATDRRAFGVSRAALLERLSVDSRMAVVFETPRGVVSGWGMLRGGARALYLGPVVAASTATGLRVLEALLATAEDAHVFWDIPDANKSAVAFAARHGFVPQRDLTRMVLGENVAGDPRKQFALAGPEVG